MLLLVMGLVGCAPGTLASRPSLQVTPGRTLVTLYFSTTGVSSEQVSFAIDEIALLLGDLWIDLPAAPLAVDRQQVQGRQLLVGIGAFPAGDCRRIRFKLRQIQTAVPLGAGSSDQFVELPLAQPVIFSGNDSTCLFVDWNLGSQMFKEGQFVPAFAARGQELPLGGDLAYVLCDDIDTLYMVRTDQNVVTAALGFSGPLGELAVDSLRRRLYLISTTDRLIYMFNSANARTVDRIALPMVVTPRFLALSEDGVFAYVSDADTGRVLKIDLSGGLIARETTSGLRPEKVLFFNDGSAHLAISSPTAQRIMILNADTLELQREFPAGSEADSLLYYQERLYVAERDGQAVAVYDYRTGRQLARVSVGFEPSDLLEVDGRVFVSNQGEGSLSVFNAGQNTTARRIPVGEGPVALAVSERRRLLYIADRAAQTLSVMDLSGERIKAVVPLGGSPAFVNILD